MANWKNDNELFGIAKNELFVALVGDVLDKLKYEHQFITPKKLIWLDILMKIGNILFKNDKRSKETTFK